MRWGSRFAALVFSVATAGSGAHAALVTEGATMDFAGPTESVVFVNSIVALFEPDLLDVGEAGRVWIGTSPGSGDLGVFDFYNDGDGCDPATRYGCFGPENSPYDAFYLATDFGTSLDSDQLFLRVLSFAGEFDISFDIRGYTASGDDAMVSLSVIPLPPGLVMMLSAIGGLGIASAGAGRWRRAARWRLARDARRPALPG